MRFRVAALTFSVSSTLGSRRLVVAAARCRRSCRPRGRRPEHSVLARHERTHHRRRRSEIPILVSEDPFVERGSERHTRIARIVGISPATHAGAPSTDTSVRPSSARLTCVFGSLSHHAMSLVGHRPPRRDDSPHDLGKRIRVRTRPRRSRSATGPSPRNAPQCQRPATAWWKIRWYPRPRAARARLRSRARAPRCE